MWVPSSDCPTSQCPYTRFNANASSTFKTTGDKFSITYGIGSVNGSYVTDTVTVAGASIQNQRFGLATSTQDILTNPTTVGGSGTDTPSVNVSGNNSPVADGILGLGFPDLTAGTNLGEASYNPFVFNLVAQKVIQDPVFSVYLNNANDQGWAGEIIFGGTDSSKYTGNLVYLPVAALSTGIASQSYYYWMVYGQGINVLNPVSATSNVTLSSVAPFVIDTGTTLTYFPDDVAQSIAKGIAGDKIALDSSSGSYIVDCNAAKSNAALQFEMSSTGQVSASPVTLTVPVSELVIPLDSLSIDTATICMLGIAPIGTSSSTTTGAGSSSSFSSQMYLIGDSVLRSAYLVFDIGNKRIGFAAANNVGGSVNGVSSVNQNSASSISSPLFTFTLVLISLFYLP